jgi:CubicO group peptidase (beta-lactamase class C family)
MKKIFIGITGIIVIALIALIGINYFGSNASQFKGSAASGQPLPKVTGDGWESASLADAGLDSGKITAMLNDIRNGGYENLYSLLIVKDGKLVIEEYFHGHDENSIDYLASVTKSVTSLMIGVAIDQGKIKGVDQYISELLPAYADILNADPLKRALQLRHLLTMTSGIAWDEASYPYGSSLNDATRMERSQDPVRFILDRPIIRKPGTQFQYCGANSMLLSAILQEATGMTVADYAKQYLFEPLRISKYRWDSYLDGHTHTDGGLSLRPRDMAKIGQLMLNHGKWDGLQVISPEWINESTQAHTPIKFEQRYGYQWWRETQAIYLETVDPYFAAGFGGQLIFVYPDQKMIVIFTSDLSDHNRNSVRISFLRTNYILPAAIPAVLSKTILWTWYLLMLGSLAFLILDVVKGKLRGSGRSVYWLLIGALFGPLGLAAYVLSDRNQRAMKVPGLTALGIAVFSATGNIVGLILLVVFQVMLLPGGSVILLVLPVSFLISWLVFIAPLVASTRSARYWKAMRQTFLTAIITSCFVIAGTFPILALLSIRWFLYGFDLANPMFWVMMTACGIAAALVVYPFSLWMTHRNLDFWPVKKVEGHEIEPPVSDRRLLTLRNAWPVFLLGLIVLIAVFGVLVAYLS